MHARVRVLEHRAIKHHAAFHLVEACECSQERRLARAVGPEHRERLAGGHAERHVQSEGVALDAHRRLESHSAPNQRSRMPTRIATETTSRMRLSVIAASGLLSRAR